MADIKLSGSFGRDIQWALYSDGRLAITGSGEMSETCFSRALCDDARNREVECVSQFAQTGLCETVKTAEIGEGVTLLGECLFADCANLVEVSLPSTLVTIEPAAFAGCAALAEIDIPDSVEHISAEAFLKCAALKTVRFGENSALKTVGYQAFRGCAVGEGFTLPLSVERVGQEAFRNCKNLAGEGGAVYLGGWCVRCFDAARIVSPLVIQDGTAAIADGAFRGYLTKEVTLPESLKSVGAYAFAGCKYLKKVNMPSHAVRIAPFAFEGAPLE